MAVIRNATPDNGILLAVEFLANRMAPNNTLYFRGDSTVSHVVNSNIPVPMKFETDQLVDSIKNAVSIMKIVLEEKKFNPKTKKGMEKDIAVLQQIIDG